LPWSFSMRPHILAIGGRMSSRSNFLARAGSCLAVVLLAASATAFAQAPGAAAPGAPPAGAAPRGGGAFSADPRAQVRSYHFAEAGQDMQYCVFASTKVRKDEAAPLIVSLHGM